MSEKHEDGPGWGTVLLAICGLLVMIIGLAILLGPDHPRFEPCHEGPAMCQARLGDRYEVIYDPSTKEAWGELR